MERQEYNSVPSSDANDFRKTVPSSVKNIRNETYGGYDNGEVIGQSQSYSQDDTQWDNSGSQNWQENQQYAQDDTQWDNSGSQNWQENQQYAQDDTQWDNSGNQNWQENQQYAQDDTQWDNSNSQNWQENQQYAQDDTQWDNSNSQNWQENQQYTQNDAQWDNSNSQNWQENQQYTQNDAQRDNSGNQTWQGNQRYTQNDAQWDNSDSQNWQGNQQYAQNSSKPADLSMGNSTTVKQNDYVNTKKENAKRWTVNQNASKSLVSDDEDDDWERITGTNWRQNRNSSSASSNTTKNDSEYSDRNAEKASPFKKKKKVPLPAEKDTFKENAITVIAAIIVALIVRTLWVEPFSIPSGSMLPTLQIGDYVFVSKSSYGYSRYSLPFGIPVIDGRIRYEQPEVGDVAVFKLPTDTSVNYIKRIIGLPGDTIQVFNGRLVINGEQVERKEVGSDFIIVEDGKYRSVIEYIETLPNGKQHSIFEISDNERFDNTRIFTVPYGSFFVMGDNRDNSLDSRSDEVGFIPVENLVGKARYIFFSKTPEFSWLKFWSWFSDIRKERIGNEIE